jgi:hypothetical protein
VEACFSVSSGNINTPLNRWVDIIYEMMFQVWVFRDGSTNSMIWIVDHMNGVFSVSRHRTTDMIALIIDQMTSQIGMMGSDVRPHFRGAVLHQMFGMLTVLGYYRPHIRIVVFQKLTGGFGVSSSSRPNSVTSVASHINSVFRMIDRYRGSKMFI